MPPGRDLGNCKKCEGGRHGRVRSRRARRHDRRRHRRRPFEGDVAVKDGKIAQVGKVAGGGAEEIDAKGKLVTPGFVDIHTHYDGQVTWADRMQPSSGHGVTTVVMGNCGVGFAPCRPDQHDLMIRVMEGVEDIPGIVMAEGMPWNWETFPEYLDSIGTAARRRRFRGAGAARAGARLCHGRRAAPTANRPWPATSRKCRRS